MLVRQPTRLSDDELEEFRSHSDEFRHKIRRFTEEITAEIPSELASSRVDALAFSANDALPKRENRPTRRIEYLVEQLYKARDGDPETLENLLKFTILTQEYFDIADDIIDGDVAHRTEGDVFITLQYLMPLTVSYVSRLGTEAGEYWAENTVRMVDCFTVELASSPDADTYLDILDKQARLFGSVTGLCARVTDGDDSLVERYDTAGALYFKFEQLLLDGYQFGDETYPWNAWELFSQAEAVALLKQWRDELETALAVLPEERQQHIRPLIAVDIPKWADETVAE